MHISKYFQTLETVEKTLSDKNEPNTGDQSLIGPNIASKNGWIYRFFSIPQVLDPFRTAVPFWGQTSQIWCNLTPKRHRSSKEIVPPRNTRIGTVNPHRRTHAHTFLPVQRTAGSRPRVWLQQSERGSRNDSFIGRTRVRRARPRIIDESQVLPAYFPRTRILWMEYIFFVPGYRML